MHLSCLPTTKAMYIFIVDILLCLNNKHWKWSFCLWVIHAPNISNQKIVARLLSQFWYYGYMFSKLGFDAIHPKMELCHCAIFAIRWEGESHAVVRRVWDPSHGKWSLMKNPKKVLMRQTVLIATHANVLRVANWGNVPGKSVSLIEKGRKAVITAVQDKRWTGQDFRDIYYNGHVRISNSVLDLRWEGESLADYRTRNSNRLRWKRWPTNWLWPGLKSNCPLI